MKGKLIIALHFIGSFDRYMKNEKEKKLFPKRKFPNRWSALLIHILPDRVSRSHFRHSVPD